MASRGPAGRSPQLAVVCLVLLTACGQGGAPPAAGPADPSSSQPSSGLPTGVPTGADQLALRVEHVGGFVTPTMLATRLPVLSVYGDGRVVTEGPVIAIYPAPALPNLQERRIDPADVPRLVQLAQQAGVGADPDLGQPPIADATSTRFVVVTGAGRAQLDAYALAETPTGDPAGSDHPADDLAAPDLGLTPEQRAARAELNDLLGALTDLAGTLGSESVSAEAPYAVQAVAAVATPWVDPGADDPDAGLGEPAEVAWPGPGLPGEPMAPGPQTGCVTVTGEQATAVLDAAERASAITPWTSAGARWSVALRPLLPDETGCADLQRQQ